MGKRRTKKQKIKAKERRYVLDSSFDKNGAIGISIKDSVEPPEKKLVGRKFRKATIGYSSSLIIKDLRKTILLSLVILMIEVGLYYYLR